MGPKKFDHASRLFWEAVERRASSRKAIVAALRQVGHTVSESSVGAWVRGESEPDLRVTLWCSERWDVSLDELRLGQAFEAKISDQLTDLERRLSRVETRLRGWEIEAAAAAGQEPPDDDEGTVSLEAARWRRRVEELEAAVRELRRQKEA